MATPAFATPTVHEITANWAGDPLPTEAPYGQPVTAEWRINTNDATDPFSNEDVTNVRATLTAGNGTFTSIPAVCKTTDVTPISEISPDGTTLLCNIGTVKEGTSSLIQAPVRATGVDGGNLTLSGTATSDDAVGESAPASPGPLPITYSHGMDVSLEFAPAQQYQGGLQDSRSGGQRTFIQMNFSLILQDGSRPGPESYSFPVTVSATNPAILTGLQWENCVPIGGQSRSAGQPSSDSAAADHTNFPDCSVSGSGTNYTVSLSDLDYSLITTPTNDSMGNLLPAGGAYIASGTVQFSVPTRPAGLNTYAFATTPPPFTFADGAVAPDTDASNNTAEATIPPTGAFSTAWHGTATDARSSWDINLWVSPGTGQELVMPQPGIVDEADWREAVANGTAETIPLYMQSNSSLWNTYQGPGGEQLAGTCTLNQNPVFIPRWFDGSIWEGELGYHYMETARYFYSTTTFDTKTETCDDASEWIEAFPADGAIAIDPRAELGIRMELPAGVTGIKMTWDPTIDRPNTAGGYTFLRAFGHIDPAAPSTGEGWTVGAFKAPSEWPGFPSVNGWTNASTTQSPGGADLPGSTYGPRTNVFRDPFRLQGPEGLVTKQASDTTAQPGVPVTYTLEAQAKSTTPNPMPASFSVVDTLPAGMQYVAGSSNLPVSVNGQVLTWDFSDIEPNVAQTITYQAVIPEGTAVEPGSLLKNTAVINVPGDNRPEAVRSANATVLVPSSSSTNLGKSTENNLLSFFGDSSAWVLTIASEDPEESSFTDTIDILPQVGDGRGTNIDGTYTVTGVTAPTGSTVYYTSADFDSLSGDARDASNGTAPGTVDGNTVGWSTTAIPNPTAVRVIGPALAPGATQTIRIAYDTPEATSCEAPADGDNKPGQVLVNSATTIAEHTELPMRSSATTTVGTCYSADLKKYVQDNDGEWHDANEIADAPQFRIGDTIRYRIVVENIGQGTLTNIAVSDDLQPELGSFVIDSLARGESQTHEYEIVLEADGPDLVVNTACASADIPADAEEVVIPCDPAIYLPIGDPEHTKTLVSANPIGDGQWELLYGIDVENTSTYVTEYSLDDTLQFAEEITVASAEVTASPDGVTLADPAWDGEQNLRIATAVPMVGTDDEGYAAHHYEVRVIADVPLQFEGAGSADDPTQCVAGEDGAGRAFKNTTALTDALGVETDEACDVPPSIDISKTVSGGPTPNGDGTWTATYDIVATNAGAGDGIYTITDMMTAGGDLEVISGAVVATPEGVTASPDWTGLGSEQTSPENLIAADVALEARGTHTYQVQVILAVDASDGIPTLAPCTDGADGNGGLSNTAGIEHNDLADDASACITVTYITVNKTVASGPTPNDDGTWTIVYDIVAENVGANAGDYDVHDQLLYGGGIQIKSTAVSAPEGVIAEADWTGLGEEADSAENLVAADVTLAGGSTHTYSVEVVVSIDKANVDPADLECPAPGERGGLANGTTLNHNGTVVGDGVCAALPLIEIAKSISDGPTANGDGTWTITYDLVATNTGAATGTYDLADDLNYGAGIVVDAADVTVLPEGVIDPVDWTGQGDAGSAENVVATDVSIDAGAVHTYQVQVVVSLDRDTATPASLRCDADGSGAGGLANTAELTHNGETQNDDACANLPLIEITKSLSGAVAPVDGEDGVYDATYEITVTNRGLADGLYNLDDRLAVGAGVTVIGVQSVTTDAPASVGVNPDFGTGDDVRIVTDQPIAAAEADVPVVHTYAVTVRYALDLTQVVTPAVASCTVEGGVADGTLHNVAEVTWNGIPGQDDECIIPGLPTLDKELVSAQPVGDGRWEVVYDLTVGNTTGQATSYDLDDEFLFAPDVAVDAVEVSGPEGVDIDGSFDGADNQRIATDVSIAGLDDDGYAPHVYTVTVLVEVPLSFGDAQEDGTGSSACTVAPGGNHIEQGLNNAATLTDETGRKITDTDCAPLPSIDIAKSIVGSPVKGENNEWTVTYEIVASNTGAADGEYTLTDRLRFGAGINITSAAVIEVPEGITAETGWTGQGDEGADENIVAAGILPAGGVHTYQVVVTATLDTGAANTTTLTCPEPGSDQRGGFANTAGIVHNDLTDTADACATPEWPKDVPPPLAITGGQISVGLIGGALLLLIAGGLFLSLRRRREAVLD